MSQSHVPLTLTDDALAVVDQALTDLETLLATPSALYSYSHMHGRSEAFCRQALSALAQHPILIPPTLKLVEAQTGLATLDRLRPRMQRLQRLVEHVQNIQVTLGNEVLNCVLQAYALLRASGKNQCLDELLRDPAGPQAEPACWHELVGSAASFPG